MAQLRSTLRNAAPPVRRPPLAARTLPSPAAAPSVSQRLRQQVGNQAMGALLARAAGGAVAAAVGNARKAPAQAAPAPRPAPAAREAAAPAAKPVQAAGAAPAAAPAAGKEERKTAAPPNARQALGPVVRALHKRAKKARTVMPAGDAVGSAQKAAIMPAVEQKRGAAHATVATLDAAETKKLPRDTFKDKLKEAILAATTPKPKTEAAADKMMKTGAATASTAMRGQLGTARDTATGTLKTAAASEASPAKQEAPAQSDLKTEKIGPAPASVSAAPAVPQALPPERLDYSEDRAPTEQLMTENGVSKQQMEKGNDPAFGPVITARDSAEKHEAAAEAKYRQSEAKVQDHAAAVAGRSIGATLAGMHGSRALGVGHVVLRQVGTMSKNAAERKRITDTINSIKDQTRFDVGMILSGMETEAATLFEAGLARAEKAYEATFEEAKGGVGTWLTTWGDDWEQLIEDSLATARTEYLRQVDVAIDQVADAVDTKLNAAKKRVAEGMVQVETFVKGLDQSVQKFGDEALQAVAQDFSNMTDEIDQRRDALVDKLADQYKASFERMSAMEEKLREANKSLWQRVYDATVGLIKKILAFKDMLLSILSKAAGVIGDIISDPIGFLGNLVSAVMQGMSNFKANIATHLKRGLMDWLFGALGGAGLKLPDEFDLKGIVSIVLQVLGLTYANFRARAVKIVGEPAVAALEKTAEVFKVLITEGIPGLWRFIKEQMGDLKSMVLDAIFDFVKERVIVAGITWIVGLLNPASAFFKACKAIYDIVMFFINRGSQIMALVNAVIDSMAAIAKGSLGTAAQWIENALAKAIPVAIGFLAGLLGLGDISGTVRKTIDKAQAPVNKAMDWVIGQAFKLVKAAGKLVMGAIGKIKGDKPDKKLETAEGKQAALDMALAESAALIADPKTPVKKIQKGLAKIKKKYKLNVLTLVTDSNTKEGQNVHVHAEINPSGNTSTVPLVATALVAVGDEVLVEFGGDWHIGKVSKIELGPELVWCDIAGEGKRGIAFHVVEKNYGASDPVVIARLNKKAMGLPTNPYAHLTDVAGVGPKKHYTSLQKAAILAANVQKHGFLKDDKHGTVLVPSVARTKGSVVDPNAAEVDHDYPRSKGGWNTYANAVVLANRANIAKSNKLQP